MGDDAKNRGDSPDFSFLGDETDPGPDESPSAEPGLGSVEPVNESATASAKPVGKRKPSANPRSVASAKSKARSSGQAPETSVKAKPGVIDVNNGDSPVVPQKWFAAVAGYALALTLLFLISWLSGRLSLSGGHQLESLPDLKPLTRGEFQHVPNNASLPKGHLLKLGESRRFGDVLFTPTKVTLEVVTVTSSTRPGEPPEQRTESPVLKLWFRLENVSTNSPFAPWDVGLMCHRSPEYGNDAATLANSFLRVSDSNAAVKDGVRVLNYLHPPGSPFTLVDQHSGKVLRPGESMTTFVASAEEIAQISDAEIRHLRWRLQFRKGVNRSSGNGVTTLVDVTFDEEQIRT